MLSTNVAWISYWAINSMNGAWRYLFFTRSLATITKLGSSTIDTISRDFGTDGPVKKALKFSYKFKVDGKIFYGSSGKDPFDNSILDEETNKMLNTEKLMIGDEIKVFYDPEKPETEFKPAIAYYFPSVVAGLRSVILSSFNYLINDWL